MATNVYANGLEIACKAADGEAKTAFPDPCWSPPGPAAGPVLIPYPNTAFAKDITNGTATVFIKGMEVAVEDKAYFATSTGNEPATKAFGQGQKTGVITGKAYFQTWSSDVLFEGLGVDRHTDQVSHNHGSMPSNTPLFPYISRGIGSGNKCKKEEERIERACKPESEHSAASKEIKGKSKLSALLKLKRKTHPDGKKGKDKHWTEDHCDGLHVALGSQSEALKYAEEMGDIYKKLPGELEILGALEGQLTDLVVNAGEKALAKWTAKTALKQVGASALPVVGNFVMGAISAVDGIMTVGSIVEIRKVAMESLEQLAVLKDKVNVLGKMTKEFENFEKLGPQEQLEQAQKLGAEGQDILATLNPCTRARKCNLVPKKTKDGDLKVETADGKGCCPGQTGHHLIYHSMIENSGCPGYNYNTAPTVCTEGATQHFGSHARVHDRMDLATRGLVDKGMLQNGTMSMDQGITNAVKSHKEAFPLSGCSDKCIRAQLEAYYKAKCPNARLNANDKNGNPMTADRGSERN